MPCSKGKADEHGNRCAYAETEPQTMEGWQAWDVALRCAGQLRTARLVVVGIDMNAAIRIGEIFGYDPVGLAELLPACESGMVSAINAKVNEGLK